MTLDIQRLALKRRTAIFIPENPLRESLKTTYIAKFLQALEERGFSLNLRGEKLIEAIREDRLTKSLMQDIILQIDEIYGLDKESEEFYKNFPQETEEKSQLSLYLDSFIYAASGFELEPLAKEEVYRTNETYLSKKELKSLSIISEEDISEIFENICLSTLALSETDYKDLRDIIQYKEITRNIDLKDLFARITFKEIQSFIIYEMYKDSQDIEGLFARPTDILRFLQYLREGRADLKGKFKLADLKDIEIQELVSRELKNMAENIEDILRYKEEWKHIFRFMKHKYKNTRIKTYEAYLYKKKRLESFASKEVGLYLKLLNKEDQGESAEIRREKLRPYLSFLEKRPGELLRRIDKIARLALDHESRELLYEKLRQGVEKSEFRISYQLYNRLVRRNKLRGVNIQGVFTFIDEAKEYERVEIDRLKAEILRGLEEKYKDREKVYVRYHPMLKNLKVNTSNSASTENFQGLEKGDKIEIRDDIEYIRLFTQWSSQKDIDYLDIDLSAIAISDQDDNRLVCDWDVLDTLGMVHSGDVRCNNGREYIDIDLKTLKYAGYTKVIAQNINFTGTSIEDIKTGLMVLDKENKQKGQIFKENEVLLVSKQKSKAANIISFYIDLEKNELVWIDTGHARRIQENSRTMAKIEDLCEFFGADTMTLYEAFKIKEDAGSLEFVKEEDEPPQKEEVLDLVTSNGDGTYTIKKDLIYQIIMN